MRSLDTNILLYATNADCPEHDAARRMIESALAEPADWIVADQVYFELYRLLRNPAVLERPLTAAQSADVIDYYRRQSGWGRCAWEPRLFSQLFPYLTAENSKATHVFDLVLAFTLQDADVSILYTRNTRDFAEVASFELVNPIDGE